MEELTPWLALSLLNGVKPGTFNQLFTHYPDAAAICAAPSDKLSACGLTARQIDQLKSPDEKRIEANIEWANQADHHLLTFNDNNYPEQLKRITDAPAVLFVNGDPDYLHQPQLAMVGSRSPTAAGRRTAEDFARHLSVNGLTITSGLALGIDGACHEGALQGMAGTVAVVAHGLDRIYPAQHRPLAHRICEQGALVSEQPLGVSPHPGLFPLRNRIISGLSLGVLVVEAARQSGSLITARHAIEQGREVFAIPGSIHNPSVRGCHMLIKQGAKLVETAEDILEELQILVKDSTSGNTNAENSNSVAQQVDTDYQKLFTCLDYNPVTIDHLVDCSGLTAADIASMLLILELQGDVVTENGLYTRVSKRE